MLPLYALSSLRTPLSRAITRKMFKWLYGEKETEKKESTSNSKQSRGGQDSKESKSNDPSSHTDDPISNDDYFIVRNPLVLLICSSEYEGGWESLEGVKTDYKILHKLFSEFFGWKVDSIYQNVTQKAILDFMDLHKGTIMTDKNPCSVFPCLSSLGHRALCNVTGGLPSVMFRTPSPFFALTNKREGKVVWLKWRQGVEEVWHSTTTAQDTARPLFLPGST